MKDIPPNPVLSSLVETKNAEVKKIPRCWAEAGLGRVLQRNFRSDHFAPQLVKGWGLTIKVKVWLFSG